MCTKLAFRAPTYLLIFEITITLNQHTGRSSVQINSQEIIVPFTKKIISSTGNADRHTDISIDLNWRVKSQHIDINISQQKNLKLKKKKL